MKFLINLFALLLIVSCASKEASVKVPHQPTEWDHKQIRAVREAEAAQSASEPAPSEELPCQVMTRSEMTRAKASGCKKMDPREGQGSDAFCCPR